jgi:hypothetical protein
MEELQLMASFRVNSQREPYQSPPAGTTGGAVLLPINDGNQIPRRNTHGDGGCRSLLQDVAAMAATMNNNEGMLLLSVE